METNDEFEFECETCGVMFREMLYEVAKEIDRVHYREGAVEEVEILGGENLANFCSKQCRNATLVAVMAREGVPIKRVGVDPIEPCAKCGGPVDMSDYHLTYVEQDIKFLPTSAVPQDVDYLAVVCRNCAPVSGEQVVEVATIETLQSSAVTK